MQTNAQLALVNYSFSAAGACGASLLVASVALSAPDHQRGPGGGYSVLLNNDAAAVPVHLECRAAYTDLASTIREVPLFFELMSSTHTFGGSAFLGKNLLLILSGQGAGIQFLGVTGSALRVYVMPASNLNSATVISGACSVWRV